MRSVASRFVAIILLTTILLPFQNCTGGGFRSILGGGTGGGLQQSGNGDGYTGKVYVSIGECGGVPGSVVSKIQNLAGVDEVEMVRENCQDIVPKVIDNQKISVSASNEILFDGLKFIEDPRLPVITSVEADGDAGEYAKIVGTDLCNADRAVQVLSANATQGEFPLGASDISCNETGTQVRFKFPTSFFNDFADSEPISTSLPISKATLQNKLIGAVVTTYAMIEMTHSRVRLKNSSPEGFNSVDTLLRRKQFGQPRILFVRECIGVTGECARLLGDNFGGPTCLVTLVNQNNFMTETLTVACTPHEAQVQIPAAWLDATGVRPPMSITLSNGYRSALAP